MPQYEIEIDIVVTAEHKLLMMGNTPEEARVNALESTRASMMVDPMRLLKKRKVELETVYLKEVKE